MSGVPHRGYAGYVPAKLPPSRPTPAQAALWDVNSLESLETVGKLLKNTVLSPKEEKFRRIRLTNPKIHSLIVEAGALPVLHQLGWSIDPADDSYLVLPPSKYMSMAEVNTLLRLREAILLVSYRFMTASHRGPGAHGGGRKGPPKEEVARH